MSQRTEGRRLFFHQTAVLGLVGMAHSTAWASDWEAIDEDEGISVFRREIPESSLYAFRGKGIIEAPLEKILWVLADNEHRTEWVDRLQKSVVLKRNSAYDFILYQHFRSPPLISDRDFVYSAKARQTAQGDSVLDIASIQYRGAPPSVGVRGELKMSSYVAKPLSQNRTHLDVSIALDPGGDLPSWVVNLVQKSWPMNTMKALRKQVQKPFVGRLPPPPKA